MVGVMTRIKERDRLIHAYSLYVLVRELFRRPSSSNRARDFKRLCEALRDDVRVLHAIQGTRYLKPRLRVPRIGNLASVWKYAEDPAFHTHFESMLRVTPLIFDVILNLIKDHPVFHNNSNIPQTDVKFQLAITLYRLGHYGNAASVGDIARNFGYSEGAVELFTRRCFQAIESLHGHFIRPLTTAEKEVEKQWIDDKVGFQGLWREGWVMYDGTIVPLHEKPGYNGDAYYTRKSNYGLNVQVFSHEPT
jgi:hypothetical protein